MRPGPPARAAARRVDPRPRRPALHRLPTGWGNRAVVDLAFAAAGATQAVRTEVTDFRLAQSLVCRDLGVTIVPVSAVDESIAHIPLREPLEWSVKLARPAGRRPSRAAARLASAVLNCGSTARRASGDPDKDPLRPPIRN